VAGARWWQADAASWGYYTAAASRQQASETINGDTETAATANAEDAEKTFMVSACSASQFSVFSVAV
jgi:hypothetical protein